MSVSRPSKSEKQVGMVSEQSSAFESSTNSMNARQSRQAVAEQAESSDSRKLALLRRAGLFGTDTKGAVIERACSLNDLREAYRLVHSVYLGTGYIGAEPAGVRLRVFELTSQTATFVAKVDGKVVGVLSVVSDSPDLGLPSDVAFKSELDAMRARGARLCEVTNQAVAEEYRKSAVTTELMRCATAFSLHSGRTHTLATVSPSHVGFYDLLMFKKFGAERSYSDKLHDPVIALCATTEDYRKPLPASDHAGIFVRKFLTVDNPFLAQIAEWEKQAKREFLNSDLLEQLFVKERNFLAECSPDHLKVIQRRWGEELFAAVFGSEQEETFVVEGALVDSFALEPETVVYREPTPDSMVIFAGEVHAILSSAFNRFVNVFSSASKECEEEWDSFTDFENNGTQLSVANSAS